MKTLRYFLFVAILGVALGANAATWSGTKTFSADETILEAVTLEGEVTVEVAEKKTVIVSNVISGVGGSLVKKGQGHLVLAAANTFDGGVTLDAGFLDVKPYKDANDNWVTNCTPLGSGTLTILGQREGYTGDCQLGLWGRNVGDGEAKFAETTLSIANPINITGNTTNLYPAIIVYYQNVVLTGKITAAQNFYFYDDFTTTTEIHTTQSDRGNNVLSLTLGEVDVGGVLAQDGNCRFVFSKPVKAKVMDFASDNRKTSKFGGKGTNRSSVYVFGAANEVELLLCGCVVGGRSCCFDADNVFSNTLIKSDTTAGGQLYTAGKEIVVGGLQHTVDVAKGDVWTTSPGVINGAWPSGSYGKLKITGVPLSGGETAKAYRTTRELINLTSITLDAYPTFTQEFAVLSNRMTGVLNIWRGKLKVSDGASFVAVPTVTCGSEGCLEIAATADAQAFRSCKTLTVGGAMTIDGTRDDFPALTTLTVTNGATLTLSRPMTTVTTVTIAAGGTLKIEEGASLAGCTRLNVRGNLSVAAGMASAFRSDNGLSLYLYDGGNIDLHGGRLDQLKYLYLNDVKQYRGEWTSAQSPVAGMVAEGSVLDVYYGAEVSGTAYTWNGQGADDLMTTDANWATKPSSLTDGSAAVTISGGAGMAYAGDMRLASISLTNPTSCFAVTNATEDSTLTVDGKMSFAKTNITFSGKILTPYGLYQGRPGDNNFSQYLYIDLYSDTALGVSSTSPGVTFDNVEIGKSVWFKSPFESTCLRTTINSANIISGMFRTFGRVSYWDIKEGSELWFTGGVIDEVSVCQYGSGTIRISGRPFVRTSYSISPRRVMNAGRLIFDVSGCDIGAAGNDYTQKYASLLLDGDGAVLETTAQRAFTNGWVIVNLQYGSTSKTMSSPSLITWDLHTTTQAIDILTSYNAHYQSALHGNEGALLEIQMRGTNRVDLTGGLGLHMKGAGTFALCGRRDICEPYTTTQLTGVGNYVPADKQYLAYSSTGPLTVSNGRLELWSDCCWTNGTEITMCGDGTLAVSTAEQLNAMTARLHFADNGKLEIPEGVVLKVAEAYDGETQVPSGEYRANDGQTLANRITGLGTLKITNRGTTLYLW